MSKKNVVYYINADGSNPVLKEINNLSFKDKQKIMAYVSLLEETGEGLRRPVADYVGDKLYELRPKLHRVLYFFMLKDYAIIVHCFRKKTDKLPAYEKEIALKRRQDFLERYQNGFIKMGVK